MLLERCHWRIEEEEQAEIDRVVEDVLSGRIRATRAEELTPEVLMNAFLDGKITLKDLRAGTDLLISEEDREKMRHARAENARLAKRRKAEHAEWLARMQRMEAAREGIIASIQRRVIEDAS